MALSNDDTYGIEFIIAVVTTALIFNIILLVRIKYGDATITHITTVPYKISMILLIDILLITICALISSRTGNLERYINHEIDGFFGKVPFFIIHLA